MLGLTFVLFAIAIVQTARTPRLIGYLMGLSGLAYIAQGFVTGSEGFSANLNASTLLGYIPWLAWSIWLLILAWRTKESTKSLRDSNAKPEATSSIIGESGNGD